MEANKKLHLIITRQKDANSAPYQEEFFVPYRPNMNVVAALIETQKRPINSKGEQTTPVVWESVCLEEVCGACSMIINGKPLQACSALIDKLEKPIRIAPLTTFPVIRDLWVDRNRMFDALKKVKAWIPVDGSFDLGPGPRISAKEQQISYKLSECMTCGLCLEACPNVNDKSNFIGPAPLSQARLFNAHPTGAMHKEERLKAIMEDGGLTACGNSQNCVRACPKGIPLDTSIADLNRQTTVQSIKNLLG